jgi:endonuclease/exonuclease/phosphatase family metal-dependent hydrolase
MQLTIMSQNVQYSAITDGRWPVLADTISAVDPDVLMLQEVVELAHSTRWGAVASLRGCPDGHGAVHPAQLP